MDKNDKLNYTEGYNLGYIACMQDFERTEFKGNVYCLLLGFGIGLLIGTLL